VLEISLLGDQRVALDGDSLAPSLARRAVEILGFVAIHPGQPQLRSQLAVALWPDSSDAQALTNLRRELHHLRSLLGDNATLGVDSRTVCWQPGKSGTCDVSDFVRAAADAREHARAGDAELARQHAARAVQRYGGDLMPGSTAEWMLKERDALHRQCVQLLDQLLASGHEGAVSEALEHAQQRLTLEPMQETSYRELMRLQALAGDRAAAIQTYHRCVAVLDKELGVEPDEATVTLYGKFVSTKVPTKTTSTPTHRKVGDPELVGRERELASLFVWRNRFGAGAEPLHLLRGEAGMGKSRLLREVVKQAEAHGDRFAVARCYAGHGRIALGPVAEWLGSESIRAHRGELDEEWRFEVERLLPPEAGVRRGPRPSPMIDAWQRHHFFEGLARALVSSMPTLLVLDDLQWCDAETLSWLPLFLELVDGYPVQVLAGLRDEQMPGYPELGGTLQHLRAAGLATETELQPLPPAATGALAESVLGSALSSQDALRWHEATGGIPLFVIEAARSQKWHEPRASEVGHLPRVQAVLQSRLQEVSGPAREVAGLAAALGREFRVELLTEASDYHEDVIVDAVDELWRRRIVKDAAGGSYDFTHDLLREAAYAQISAPARPLVHRRIAQAIELLSAGDQRAVAASLAEQYDRAHSSKRAVRSYALAAEGSTEVFAFRDAVRRYQRAIELLDDLAAGRERDDLELSLRHAMSSSLNALEGYASPNLRANLERSADLAERLGERRLHLVSLVSLFGVRFVQGDIGESYRIGEQALALGRDFPDVAGQAHFALGGAASELGRHAQAVENFARSHEMAFDYPPSLVGTRPEVHARAWSAHSLWALGRDEDAVYWADWAIARAEEVEQPYSLAVALAYATITHQLRRDVEATAHFAARTIELCERYDFAYYREWGVLLTGWCVGGELGIQQMQQGLASLREQGALARQPYYLSLLAERLCDRGQTAECLDAVESALSFAAQNEDRWWVPELMRFKAGLVSGVERANLLDLAKAQAQADGALALLSRIEAES